MPYGSVAEVPGYVPKAKRKQWLEVWNSVYAARVEDGDDKKEAERRAFAAANAKAGPDAKALTPHGFAGLMKAIGTESTGLVRAKDGPFRCAHCAHYVKKAVEGGDGVCAEERVNADPQLGKAPRSGDKVIVAAGDCCNEYEPVKREKAMTGKFKKFIPFAKVDSIRREVWGIVTAEVPDKDQEVCDYVRSKPYYQAVIDEMSKATDGENFFPLRAMHDWHKAVGKCIGFEFRDADREIFMGFKVVDDDEWRKVEERVYTGFSQGGAILDMRPDPVYEGCKRYVANPAEVSLVDNPCLATAHFAYVKADGAVELRKFGKVAVQPDRMAALERELTLVKARVGLAKTNESLDARRTAVVNAIQEKHGESDASPAIYVWLREFFDDHAVFEKDDKLWSVPYAIDDKANVKLGAATQVEVEYVPAGKAAGAKRMRTRRVEGEALPASAFLIAEDPQKPETWALPVRFSDVALTKRYVRHTIVRIPLLKLTPAKLAEVDRLAGDCGLNVPAEKRRLVAVQNHLQKRARVIVNKLSRTAPGGNVGLALASLDNDLGRLAKGMYEVGRLAQLVQELSYMYYGVISEEEREKHEDESPLPALLAENVDVVLNTLLRMVEEESAELRSDIRDRAAGEKLESFPVGTI